ncbi:MAG: disulfide bond formation protein B [Hoeflea sp.]|uniref:disulfide bond formation protein B n=1 Tax=Hoeflea sp. TaxID=1940281 RepID=UPI002730C5E8|nr:disulfide bond formation protein B [Hoeflea sp.]MDP2119612.1 disulfide bond formation protein B [Hoeflea sp.]MDP3523327.1 disulfide bond formation protein B [Hoeflea sp.]MDZ7600915.1 disulfide bond formation protein B [Hoeflea sp.]
MLIADTRSSRTLTALFLAFAMASVVGMALGFEHIGGYIPCALCLAQRPPYYIGAPLMLIAALISLAGGPSWAVRGLMAIGGLLMLYGLGLATYHSGVEWQWWPGPESCATSANAVTTDAGSLLGDLSSKRPPSCDEATFRVLGLSFAGWNVLVSAVLAAIAFKGALRKA